RLSRMVVGFVTKLLGARGGACGRILSDARIVDRRWSTSRFGWCRINDVLVPSDSAARAAFDHDGVGAAPARLSSPDAVSASLSVSSSSAFATASIQCRNLGVG